MQYNKTEWKDRKTIVNAERLNNMEEGIHNAHLEVHVVDEEIKTIQANEEEFNRQLNEIKNEKGYITTKILKDGTDFNTLVNNGKYRIFKGANAPKTGDFAFVVDVTVETQSHISQLAGLIKGEQRALYHRACIDGVWSNWARIVTNSELETIQQEIDTIKSDATTLEGRVSSSETEISNIKENILVVEEEIESIQGIIGSDDGSTSGSLLDRVSKTEQDITSLGQKVGVNETDISNLKLQDAETNTRVQTLEGKVSVNETDISALKQKDAELSTKVGALEERANTNDTEVAKLKTEDEAIKSRVSSLEEKVTVGTNELQELLQGNIDSTKEELQTNINTVDEKANQNKTDIASMNTDLQAHKSDTTAHADIRTQIGDVRNLLTISKEVVGAINEIYERGGSSRTIAYVNGSERLTRIFAETTTNVFEVRGVNLNKAEIYLMGIRIFNQEDYTVSEHILTLDSTLLPGEYIDILSMDEVIVDLGNNTIVETHHRFTAEQPTSTFPIEGGLKYGYLDVYQMGVKLYEDFDYTIDKSTNIVTLVQPLEIGEYVDYTIRSNSGMNVTDIHESIKMIPTLKTKVDEMDVTLNSSISGVEASTNYNTIKVIKNDGTVEYVELKILGGGEGSSVKLFESGRVHESYTATTDGETTFTIPVEVTTNSYVEMFFKNLYLINNVDYTLTIDEASGTSSIELKFPLKQGETVYYTVVHTSYDYNDLDNIPDLSQKIDKTQIKNTLDETVEGNVLDATQGKVLDGKINILSDKITWKPNNWKKETALPSEYEVETTSVFYSSSSNGTWNGISNCIVKTIKYNNISIRQEIIRFDSPICYRSGIDGADSWGEWQTIATTDQINSLSEQSEINLPMSQADETIAIKIKNSITQGQLSGRYRYTSGHSSDAPISKHGIISYKKTNQSKTTDIIFFADNGEVYTATLDGVTGGYISNWSGLATSNYVNTQHAKNMNYKNTVDDTKMYLSKETGIYLTPASGVTDLPEGWMQGRHTLVSFNPTNDLYAFQLIATYPGSAGLGGNRKFAIRHAITEGSKWLELATIEKTDILPSSFLNGWTAWDNGYGDKLVVDKIGSQVQLNGLLKCGVKTQDTIILRLPQGLRPMYNIIKNVACYPYGTATVEIQSVGNIVIGNISESTLAISMGDISYSVQ